MDYQYKVVQIGSSNREGYVMGGDGLKMPSAVEKVMNDMSKTGWEYSSNITPSINSKYLENVYGDILLVFRRKK